MWGIMVVALSLAGTVWADDSTNEAAIKAINLCVEAKRGQEYEIAKENALKIKEKLLPILSEDKKDISVAEWVIRKALKAWVETPEIGKECYDILSKSEKSKDIKGKPSDATGSIIRVKLGKNALPFIYEILFKTETHPYVLSGMISDLNTVVMADAGSIQVVMEFLKIEKVLEGNKLYYIVNGFKWEGSEDISSDAVWDIPSSAIWVLGGLGEKLNDTRPLDLFKNLYIDSEIMEPFKNIQVYNVADDAVAKRNHFKKIIIGAIERIGQEKGKKVLTELAKTEKQDEIRQLLSESRQRVIEKMKEKDKGDKEKNKDHDKDKKHDKDHDKDKKDDKDKDKDGGKDDKPEQKPDKPDKKDK
jgi:hypothetical protein